MHTTTEILVVLGAPNSDSGLLSPISISRLNACIQQFSSSKRILCTGGFGSHFNRTKTPHATYAKDYLRKYGIPERSLLPSALSSNTVDDAVKIKPILNNLAPIQLTIISSDYHIKRVQFIFNEILKEYPKSYVGVPSNLDLKTLEKLQQHEKKSLELMRKVGLYYS